MNNEPIELYFTMDMVAVRSWEDENKMIEVEVKGEERDA